MFNKLIKYIITLLLSIIIFCIIPKEFNPIANIFLFVLLGLLIIYFIDTCRVFEYFNIDNKNKDLSNNILINEAEAIFEDEEAKKVKEAASIKIQQLIQDRIDEIKNIKQFNQLEEPEYKDISHYLNSNAMFNPVPNPVPSPVPNPVPNPVSNTNNCKNNDKLIILNNVHDNIQNLVLPYLENIIYNNNTIKIKSQITDIIISIKRKDEPYIIYGKIDILTNLLKDSNPELYDLFKHITLILNSIINQKPIDLNSNIISNIQSDIILDVSNNLYIKKHFLPLFDKLLLVILSYNKLPDKLQSQIKYIINLINNDANINNILNKIKEINNDILTVLNDKQIISDKIAKTYLLMSKTILDVIIKNYKLIILQEPLEFKSDILKLNKDMEIIMKTHLEKILKLIISLEYNSSDDSNIKTYLLVDFNPAVENITNNNDTTNTQISDMLKQLANKLETSNNECDCENKVKEAVDKYLKNGKYIDDNGIIKNIMNSDMIYNQLDISMLQSLGSYDNSFSNKWDKGYTYLDTSKWTVPKVHIPPPPNINNIHSSLTPGYPINVLEFDNSRKVLGPDNINLQYIKEKLN
jgi:hypothetical protein